MQKERAAWESAGDGGEGRPAGGRLHRTQEELQREGVCRPGSRREETAPSLDFPAGGTGQETGRPGQAFPVPTRALQEGKTRDGGHEETGQPCSPAVPSPTYSRNTHLWCHAPTTAWPPHHREATAATPQSLLPLGLALLSGLGSPTVHIVRLTSDHSIPGLRFCN